MSSTTPTPAPAPMTARLRELEASAAELANKLADAAAHWRTKEFDDLCHANTGVIIEALRNTPTILRLLEAEEGAECALRIIAGEGQRIDNLMSNSDVACSALATLRAAREVRAVSDIYTKRLIGHDEAVEVASRLINSRFNTEPGARVSIPARPDYDDDLLILAYIEQQRARP